MNTLKDELYNLDQQIKYSIEVYGWHVIKVPEDEKGPSFGYSIGLFKNFKHPEIIIVGPEIETIHYLINKVGEAIMKGAFFYPDYYHPSLVEDAYLYFASVDKIYYDKYVEYALRYYKDQAFPILQCLYPSPNGAYPGQPNYSEPFKKIQPFLGNNKSQ